jgi:uncharacterized protein YcfL
MRKLVFIVMGLVALIGCSSNRYTLNTPSGAAEITLMNTSKEEVNEAFAGYMVDLGFQPILISENKLIFKIKSKESKNIKLYRREYDYITEWRLIYFLLEPEDNVRIVTQIYAINNPGSRLEHDVDVSKNSLISVQMQEVLKTFEKNYIENKK